MNNVFYLYSDICAIFSGMLNKVDICNNHIYHNYPDFFFAILYKMLAEWKVFVYIINKFIQILNICQLQPSLFIIIHVNLIIQC